ncbi:MAG TPA: gephyrin-like molybdotransferase Glp [Candidatus Limnocylindrales bacterium]|nr:gephyrin-like molybdotransferase Glp [Candidatus Limnocylindrales bacterium]
MLSFTDARRKVIEVVKGLSRNPVSETVALKAALGRILAEPVIADRDYPPFDRATRDGYAARSADLGEPGASLALVGEIRAGQGYAGKVRPGQCVQIMTGAATPVGTDAVVMVEHTRVEDAPGQTRIIFEREAQAGQNIVPRGKEARAGQTLLEVGARLGYVELSLAAQVGCTRPEVWARPRVAILSTGDEIVDADKAAGPLQVRNGNSFSLAAQVESAGGEPVLQGNAPDIAKELLGKIKQGLNCNALIISGGVSAGKYDLVEEVLTNLGTQFFFDGVAIRPGRPAVFGQCGGVPVFGLPGNPVSTMITFELFVLPALDILCGGAPRPLPLLRAKLGSPLREKPDLAHFLPARLEWTGGEPVVDPVRWQGSGDVVALASTNCFLVVREEKLNWEPGEWIDVLPRRGAL